MEKLIYVLQIDSPKVKYLKLLRTFLGLILHIQLPLHVKKLTLIDKTL